MKTSAGKQKGNLPSAPDLIRQDQAITLEECAEQLRLLKERVDFLEHYVFELLPPPTQGQLERRQPRPLAPDDVNILMEAIQGSMPSKPPEEK